MPPRQLSGGRSNLHLRPCSGGSDSDGGTVGSMRAANAIVEVAIPLFLKKGVIVHGLREPSLRKQRFSLTIYKQIRSSLDLRSILEEEIKAG